MPGTLTSYSILLELPDELEEERRAFGDTVHAFNETDATPRGVLFVPLGWEAEGAAAPSVVHDDFRTIDYFILLLWDRWPSGAQSEYELALQCLKSADYPMRQVVAFFKAPASRQLEDPGEQLKQVLQFKATLEDQRAGLIETIEDLSGFETRLRWHLSRWLIDHESPPRPSSVTDVESDEQTLPQPHPLDEDPESLNRYGLFLQRQGMLEDAEATHRSALDLLKDVGESAAVAIAHGNLGVIHSRQRRFDESEAMFRKALATCEHLGRKKGMAASYCGLGLVYRGRDDLFRSEEMFREALGIELALDRAAGIAFCYGNLALLADLRGQAEEAERMRRLARAVGEEPEYPLGELFPQEI